MSLTRQNEHGTANSVTSPAGVIRPIWGGANSELSVNQRLPSEPLVMYRGWLSAVGIRYCFSAPTGAAEAEAVSISDSVAARMRTREIRIRCSLRERNRAEPSVSAARKCIHRYFVQACLG